MIASYYSFRGGNSSNDKWCGFLFVCGDTLAAWAHWNRGTAL